MKDFKVFPFLHAQIPATSRASHTATKKQSHRNEKIAILGWLLTLIAPFLAYHFTEYQEFSEKQRLLLSILSGTVVMWGFRLIPEFVGAFFALLVYLGIGLTDPKVILSGFSSKTFIMALSIFGLSAVILSSGVLYRFLLHILSWIPSKARWIMMSLLSLGGLLTPVIPDISSRLNLATSFLRIPTPPSVLVLKDVCKSGWPMRCKVSHYLDPCS